MRMSKLKTGSNTGSDTLIRNPETSTRRRNCRKLHALLRWQLLGATRLNYVELFTAERDEVCSVQLIFFFCFSYYRSTASAN